MEVTELVVETALRALLYNMEADLGKEAARATPQYEKLNKRLSELEGKHVAEFCQLMGL